MSLFALQEADIEEAVSEAGSRELADVMKTRKSKFHFSIMENIFWYYRRTPILRPSHCYWFWIWCSTHLSFSNSFSKLQKFYHFPPSKLCQTNQPNSLTPSFAATPYGQSLSQLGP